jgi:TonB-linked SusC/RagA family outer membrane protein
MKTSLNRLWLLSIFLVGFNSLYGQSITGTVTEDNTPLPGVSVLVKGTQNGTTTDFDGNYTLTDVADDAVIQYRFLGFKTVEIQAASQSVIDVSMEPDAQALDEVVIIGLGQTQNKRTVTSSIAKVGSKEITELSVPRPEVALQGTVPGVVVAQNSGSPGSPLAVRIRGISTPNVSEPLYLVDGFQVPNLNHLNAADLATINVLKDAAAVAVYGARGGSGVVLVETNKGQKNQDHLRVSVEGYYGFQNVLANSDLMNKDEYLLFYKSAIQYAETFGDQYLPAVFNTIEEVTAQQDLLPDTDWQDLIFESNVPIYNFHAAVNDGGERYTWGITGGLFEQGGVVGGPDKSNFARKNVRLTFSYDILDNLTISANADIVGLDQKIVLENQNNETQGIGIVTAANSAAPIYTPYSPTGVIFNPSFGTGGLNAQNQVEVNGVLLNSMNIYTSPLFMLQAADQQQKTDVYQFGASLKWDVLDNLSITGDYSRFSTETRFKAFQPDFNGTPLDTEQFFFLAPTNQLNENTWTTDIDNFHTNAEYTFKNLGDHNLRALLGTAYQQIKGTAEFVQGTDLSVNTFGEAQMRLASNVTSTNPSLATNGFVTPSNESKLFSIYARAIYDFNEKYLFTASLRADSSSKFGPENQTGYFPSFSAGWVLSSENFMANARNINLLKLRASWGINGVDNIREDEFNSSYNEETLELERLANENIKWEEIEQANIGIDLNAFNNKLGISLDWYDKTTNGILLENPPILSSGGPGETFQNAGSVKNTGFETLISYRTFANNEGDFTFNITANLGYNDNRYEGDPSIPPGTLTGGNLRQFSTPVTNTISGQPIAAFYGFEVDYINDRGEMIFKDLDGDGVVNSVDPATGASTTDLGDRTTIGSPYPDFTYGVMIGMTYKNFDLNANLYGAAGNDIFDARYNSAVPYSNRPKDYFYNGLRPVLSGLAGSQSEVSDFYVKDGSYAKLANVSLGYNFANAARKWGVDRFRIYVQGQNLATFTDYTGGDPEIGNSSNNPNAALDVGIDRGFYPQPTTFMLGFQFQY